MAEAARQRQDARPTTADYSERRMVGQALALWERLRGARAFPSRADCQGVATGDIEPNTFLIAVADNEDEDEVVGCGTALRDALGSDPTGQKVGKILPSATERGLTFWRVCAELKKPIADIGSFTNAKGEEVLYRSVLLPLSDDQERVNYLLGAFSFRRAAG